MSSALTEAELLNVLSARAGIVNYQATKILKSKSLHASLSGKAQMIVIASEFLMRSFESLADLHQKDRNNDDDQ